MTFPGDMESYRVSEEKKRMGCFLKRHMGWLNKEKEFVGKESPEAEMHREPWG